MSRVTADKIRAKEQIKQPSTERAPAKKLRSASETNPALYLQLANFARSAIQSTGSCSAPRRRFSWNGGFENHKLTQAKTAEATQPKKERHRMIHDPETARLEEARIAKTPWKKWGPYLSERQWGTVREDYSPDGNAWDYFTHDVAGGRADC